MPKRGRKYREAAAKVDHDKLYTREEAVKLIKETAFTSFDPTVEVHFRLSVDPRHADQQVRDVVNLPHGLGKTVRVLVFAEGEDARLAEEAGADIIADDEVIAQAVFPTLVDKVVLVELGLAAGRGGRVMDHNVAPLARGAGRNPGRDGRGGDGGGRPLGGGGLGPLAGAEPFVVFCGGQAVVGIDGQACPATDDGDAEQRRCHNRAGRSGHGWDPLYFASACGCVLLSLRPAAEGSEMKYIETETTPLDRHHSSKRLHLWTVTSREATEVKFSGG